MSLAVKDCEARAWRNVSVGLRSCGLALCVIAGASVSAAAQNAVGGSGNLGTQAPGSDRFDRIGGQGPVLPEAEVGEGETVRGRPRPAYDAQGVPVGGFTFFPVIALSETFNDNIFADETDEESDLITNIRPGLGLQSNWGRHGLALRGGADIGLHAFNPDENYEDYSVSTAGRLDIYDGAYLSSGLSFEDRHEDRRSPDDVRGEEPTEFDVYSAELLGYLPRGRFNFTISGDVTRLDFDDVGAGPGRPDIDNDDRDRTIFSGTGRLGYEIQSQYEAFLRGSYNRRDYDETVDNEGFERSSQGFDIDAGVEVDFGGLIFGNFFAGYSLQDFDDDDLETVDGPSVGAEITWNVTPLTTLSFDASSAIQETTIVGASGVQAYGGGIAVDHELLRSLILSASGGATVADYRGIDRTDTIFRAGISAKYFINRYLNTSAGYRYFSRSSSDAGVEEFTENVVLLSLGVQY